MRRIGGTGLAFVLIALACGGTDPAAPATSTTTTVAASTSATVPPTSSTVPPTTLPPPPPDSPYGGEVVLGEDQFPPTLNPYAPGGDNFIVRIIGQAHQVGVWDVDAETLEMIPDVVTELPTVANGGVRVNPDGTMTVVYQIRDVAVWADGVPISGSDFQFTYEILTDPELGIDLYQLSAVYDTIVATEVGDKTFSYTLAAPTILYQELFRTIVPRHDVEGSDFLIDWNEAGWVAGGPFAVTEIIRGEVVVLERNDAYWKVDGATGEQLPYLDRVVFDFIPEIDSLIGAFQRQEVDIIQPPPFIPSIKGLRALEEDGASITVRSGPIWEHFNFQFGPGRFQANPDSVNEHLLYRRAIAHAIDRDAVAADLLGGLAGALTSHVDAFTPALSLGAWDQYPYDPDHARQLLAQLCADLARDCDADPITTVFSTTSNADERPRIAKLIGDMLADVGIEYVMNLQDSQLFFGDVLDNGLWDMGLWAWVGAPGLARLVGTYELFDPEQPPTGSPVQGNVYRWGTPDSAVIDDATVRFADVRDAMNATVDEADLAALLNEAEQILADNVVIIPLYARLAIGAVWADRISGYVFNPSPAGHTWNIEEWRYVGG